jgi:cytochrome P450
MERLRDRYGDMFCLRLLNEGTWVMLSDPAAVKQVFTGDPRLLHAGEANAILRPVLGPRSVLLLDGAEHMSQRKLMLPPFHGARMKAYGELMTEIAEAEVAAWPAETPYPTHPRMRALTLEIVLRTIFGVHEAARLERLRSMLTHVLDWTVEPLQLAALILAGPHRVHRMKAFRATMAPLDALLGEEIAHRRAAGDLDERADVLSMLLGARHDDDSPMTDLELRDELMTLLVAGHETTATALAWALERLARHPAAWERLRDEARAGEDAYIDAVVKETLRLRPVIPIVLRLLCEPMEIGGRLLPAGVRVAPCIYLLHRRPDIYPEPDAFRPERFLEQPAGTYTWIPFGGGVRRCLGASFALFEMATVLRVIASRFDRLDPDTGAPERIRRRAITLVPEREGRVRVGAASARGDEQRLGAVGDRAGLV